MRVRELLIENEATDPFTYMKVLQKEFAALAKEEGFVISAAMGWPAHGKDGTWFGGGFKPASRKKDDDIVNAKDLPAEARLKFLMQQVKGVVHKIAARLEELAKSGHVIKFSPGAQRGKVVVDGTPGKLEQEMLAAVKLVNPPGTRAWITDDELKLPCVAWFVSKPAHMSDVTSVRFTMTGYTGNSTTGKMKSGHTYTVDEKFTVELGGAMPTAEAKAFEKRWKKWHSANSGKWVSSTSSMSPATADYDRFAEQVWKLANKHGAKLPKMDTKYSSPYLSLKLNVLTKGTIRLPTEDLISLTKEIK